MEDYDENILKDQITTLQPSDIEVTIPEENLYGSTLGIGEKMWLPFTIQIPPDVVTPMEVSTENQTPLSYENEYECIHDFSFVFCADLIFDAFKRRKTNIACHRREVCRM